MKLTIALATYDDYDGVFFTIQSLKMHHPVCMTDEVEFLVLDSNPTSAHGKAVESFCKAANVHYMPVSNDGSWTKYKAFVHARGDVVLILDCHILLHCGAVSAVLRYFDTHRTNDMLQGPCVFDCLKAYGTHFEPEWRGHDFGIWATDNIRHDAGIPFSIPMMGMGCFAMRREGWKGINPGFKGFGSEEWYMAEKVRSWRGNVLCHPAFKWTHRWGRPGGVPYPYSLEGKIYNYAVGWIELYGSGSPQIQGMIEHFSTVLEPARVRAIIDSTRF